MQPTPNNPALWQPLFPRPTANSHKYTRGYALVAGGPVAMTGASRLAARAALRMGAGLVAVLCDPESLPIYAAALTSVMTKPVATEEDFAAHVTDTRVTGLLIGPGAGVTEETQRKLGAMLAAAKPTILDADALTLYAGKAEKLAHQIKAPCILTPHAGEFSRLFGALPEGEGRAEAVRQAAQTSGAVVVLKGAATLIAAPDGRLVVNHNATPYLATAGSGDVLAGMALGLVAQGMPAFEAACAAVWLHGETGKSLGPGLIAEDLPERLPAVLQALEKGACAIS